MVTVDLSLKITSFLQRSDQKVLLIRNDSSQILSDTIKTQIVKEKMTAHYINCEQLADIAHIVDRIILDIPPVFIFDNCRLVNYYEKYQLGRWQAKAIIICNDSLLHPTLDPSVYFAPIKKNSPQKHLLTQLKLTPGKTVTLTPLVTAQSFNKTPPPNHSLQTHFLNQKLLTNDVIMMQMLADRVIRAESFKAFLFKLVYASRDNNQLKVAAANAITILNYARVSFSEHDFARVQIPRADLSNALCHRTNFNSANLQAVKLHNVFFGGTDLSGANMSEVDFGQLPNIKFNNNITAMAMTIDNKILIIGNAAGDLIIYDAKKLEEKATLVNNTLWQGRNNKVHGISVSANGRIIAALRKDAYIYVWDVLTQKILQTFHYASDPLFYGNNSYFCLSPNGKFLALYHVRNAIIKIYNLNTGKELALPKRKWHREYDNSWHHAKIAFSLNNDALYFLTKSDIYVWRCHNENLTFDDHIAGARTTGLALSPNGKWLIISFEDKLVQYETTTHKVLNIKPIKNIRHIHFDKNCENILAVSKTVIYIWNLAANTIEESYIGISDIELSEVSDTGYFLTVKADEKNALQVQTLFFEYHQINPTLLQILKPAPFNPKNWRSVLDLGQKYNISWSLLEKSIVSNDHKLLAICDNKKLNIYHLPNTQFITSNTKLIKEDAEYDIVFSPDSRYIICYGFHHKRHGISIINAYDGKVECLIDDNKDLFLASSEYSNCICYVGEEEAITLVIFDRSFNKIKLGHHSAFVHYGAFLTRDILLTCDESGSIKFWDLLTLECSKEIKIPYRLKFKGRQTIVSECYALNANKTRFAFGYVELISEVDFEAKIAVINCVDRTLIHIKNLQADDGFTSISQIVFDETNGVVLARVNNAIAMFNIDKWRLLYSLNIFTEGFTIKSIIKDKLSIELSSGERYEIVIKQGKENYLLLTQTSAKSPLYLKDVLITDTTIISTANLSLIQQAGGRLPKPPIALPLTQDPPVEEQCCMM